ncbi:MAG: kelch repeat-containing protein [Candidatus Acidiferrum sp.]
MRKRSVLGCVCLLATIFCAGLNVQAQTWSFTGSMGAQRAFHSATVLDNGEVLVAGGNQRGTAGLGSAILYNPGTGTFSPTGNLQNRRAQHTATLLQNGRVLIAGGEYAVFSNSGTQYFCLASAELYDPSTGTFALTGSMNEQHCGGLYTDFTATLLDNGMVLIAGGSNSSGFNSAAELYDPSTGTFSLAGSLNTPRIGHTATLLPTGEVLIAGGVNSAGSYLTSAELYNPSTGTFTPTGSMKTSREIFTATLLSNGQVLVAGGQNSNFIFPYISSAEVYNPATGKWISTGNLNTGRYDHTATLLNNGQVLVAGGAAHLATAELYNPSTGKFTVTGSLNTGRREHTAVLLTDGEVLVTGEYAGSGGNIGYLSSAELFH